MEDKKKGEDIKEKKEDYVEISVGKHLGKVRKNPWIASTLVLGLLVLGLLIFGNGGGTTGNVVTAEEAGQKVVAFINSNPDLAGEVSVVSSEQDGQFYKVVINYDGQNVPVYTTLDGGSLVNKVADLNEQPLPAQPSQPEQTEVPKSDRPKVELFIWSYCPYGVQAQGPLAEVVSLLSENADFEAVMYHDGHGAYETQQNKIQACIQKLDPENYWNYAAGFVENIYPKCGSSRDIECDKTESISLMDSLGIDSASVMSCVESEGAGLLSASVERAQSNGVQGSPTLLINGVKANVARNAEAFKTAVCSAFNEAPAECSETLSSSAAAQAGNC
ncbi:MAG: DsbA family protein [Nanoarchaeota archaeon]|nr:DsbA family protein [Nanoarchaeota archaeon]